MYDRADRSVAQKLVAEGLSGDTTAAADGIYMGRGRACGGEGGDAG